MALLAFIGIYWWDLSSFLQHLITDIKPFEIKYGKNAALYFKSLCVQASVKQQLDVIIRDAAKCHLAIHAQRRLAFKICIMPGFN